MTIRLDMQETVSRAPNALGDSVNTVRSFFQRQLAPDGGFFGRDGNSDLYYTVFGLEASLTLGADVPFDRVNAYLDSFGTGASLDLVHLAALIRCRANLADVGVRTREVAVEHLLEYKSRDGGFDTAPDAERGSAYGSFLALGAMQDLAVESADTEAMAGSIASLQRADGGYANEASMAAGATPATAAAVSVLHYLRRLVPESAIQWLLARAHPFGGFAAIPVARASRPCSEEPTHGADILPVDFTMDADRVPGSEARMASRRKGGTPSPQCVPDLLSTATALHALSLIGAPLGDTRDKHLDFLDSLWSEQGGFRGHWADEIVDCEYTYYGLLALGTLAA